MGKDKKKDSKKDHKKDKTHKKDKKDKKRKHSTSSSSLSIKKKKQKKQSRSRSRNKNKDEVTKQPLQIQEKLQENDAEEQINKNNEKEIQEDINKPNDVVKLQNTSLEEVGNQIVEESSEDAERENMINQELMKRFGFTTLGTSKGRDHTASAVEGVFKAANAKRKYRQYMHRRGGFNRLLDKME